MLCAILVYKGDRDPRQEGKEGSGWQQLHLSQACSTIILLDVLVLVAAVPSMPCAAAAVVGGRPLPCIAQAGLAGCCTATACRCFCCTRVSGRCAAWQQGPKPSKHGEFKARSGRWEGDEV